MWHINVLGESGIWTHGNLRYVGFQDQDIQPLWHLSVYIGTIAKLLSICNFLLEYHIDKKEKTGVFFFSVVL